MGTAFGSAPQDFAGVAEINRSSVAAECTPRLSLRRVRDHAIAAVTLGPIEGLIGATKESLAVSVGPSEPAIPMLMVMFSVPGARLTANGVASTLLRSRSATAQRG